MALSQEFVPIKDVKDGIAMLGSGDMVMVLQTSAVNFGLLSANEQMAIIAAFAGMLNSLSFSIQIVIRSKRLDISDYLKVLDEAYQKQQNPLLANMMIRYRKFIESIVRENEVLDKQFFVVIGVSYLELGFTKSANPDMKKVMTLLVPRRDHIIRQLSRIGLKANQLDDRQLAELYYDIYNFDPSALPRVEKGPENVAEPPAAVVAAVAAPQPERVVLSTTTSKPVTEVAAIPTTAAQVGVNNGRANTPYVVEELHDDFENNTVKT